MARDLHFKLRKKYFNLCDPNESVGPEDPRCVDVDGTEPDARGAKTIAKLVHRVELSNSPACEFFTGLPGTGKSTELQRLAAQLEDSNRAHLLPVLINAEDMLDLHNPVDEADILVMVVYKTDEALLRAEGGDGSKAMQEGRPARFWHWFTTTEVDASKATVGGGAKVADIGGDAKLDVLFKTTPSLRETVRAKVSAQMTHFLRDVKEALEEMERRAKKLGYEGLVIIVDQLEKLRGTSSNWGEVLGRSEKLFSNGAPYLKLPVHVIYTIPPAVVYRNHLMDKVHFLPMLKIFDRQGNRFSPGFDAARKMIRLRIPDEHLPEFLGTTSSEARAARIIEWTGGYPREIIRLLQNCIADPPTDERAFVRLLNDAGEQITQIIPDDAFDWLARVHVEKRLIFDGEDDRAMVDRMLQNNIVLRYQNDKLWFDLHPAVREWGPIASKIQALRAAPHAG